MGRVLTYFLMAMMLILMPEFLQIMTETMGAGVPDSQVGQLSQGMAESMQSMTSLMCSISYIVGISFALKGVFALKEYSETAIYEPKQNTPVIDLISTEKKEAVKTEEIKSVVKVVESNLFKFNLDFENNLLNNRLGNIEKLINSVLHIPVLENNIESKILLSSTQEKYVQQIHTAYIAIPKELRDRDVKGSTATQLALEQLILVENGLLEMESELLNQQVGDLNIMNRFLKEKFPNQEVSIEKKYMTVN